MTLRRRFAVPAFTVLVAGIALLLAGQPQSQAAHRLTWKGLNKIQRRIISQSLESYLRKPSASARKGTAHAAYAPGSGDGGYVDGAPENPPAGYAGSNGNGNDKAALANYFPSGKGDCPSTLGGEVKVNQNCLNLTDATLQGRGQANNEAWISQDPSEPKHLLASDNNYIRGDGTCGSHYSLDGGKTWTDSVVPNSFTRGPKGGAPRQYWQAGGDTSTAWDTRGNAYMSCQVFNRGNGVDSNPDQSSGFFVYRSTQNDGASYNFPGRPVATYYDPKGTAGVLEDKQLMTVDDSTSSPYRDRIYVTWTLFAANGTAYIYEAHSSDYGETFSQPVLVSRNSAYCTNTFGFPAADQNSKCNENQFSQPFTGPDGMLYVVYDNYNNQATSGQDNRYEVFLSKSTDGGDSFGPPVKVSDYYDLPDCQTYQNDDPGRSCVPEKGSSQRSVFRATNYPSGSVDPTNASVVTVTFGSYINRYSNEHNGCVPAGYQLTYGNPLYSGVKQAGACNNKVLLSVSRDAGASFTGTAADPRTEPTVNQDPGQVGTDQFWQWSTYTPKGTLAVSYYDRQYGSDETTGASDISLSGTKDLAGFGTTRVTSSSMPPPTQFYSAKGGVFYGDYYGMTAVDGKAHPIWSDTRSPDLFLCPGTGTPGNPPAVCGATEPNGQQANDEDTFSATLSIPTKDGGDSGNGSANQK